MKIDIEGFEDQALFPFFDEAPEKLWPRCIVIEPNSKSWKRDILKHLETLVIKEQIKQEVILF